MARQRIPKLHTTKQVTSHNQRKLHHPLIQTSCVSTLPTPNSTRGFPYPDHPRTLTFVVHFEASKHHSFTTRRTGRTTPQHNYLPWNSREHHYPAMHTTMRSIALSLVFLITGTSATVSLSSFTPRVDIQNNVQCRAAYTTTIKGCQASDFTPPNRCSQACVQGLQDIGEVIKRVCQNVDVGETSIIGVFQFGIGIASLCPGVDIVTASSAAATTSTRTTQGQSTQTTTTRATTSSSVPPPAWSLATNSLATSTGSSSASQTTQSSASSSSTQGLNVDPDPTSIAGVSPTGAVQPPASSTAAAPPNSQQFSNGDSGGGSPFDVQAFGAASRSRVFDVTLAALVGTAMVFVACA